MVAHRKYRIGAGWSVVGEAGWSVVGVAGFVYPSWIIVQVTFCSFMVYEPDIVRCDPVVFSSMEIVKFVFWLECISAAWNSTCWACFDALAILGEILNSLVGVIPRSLSIFFMRFSYIVSWNSMITHVPITMSAPIIPSTCLSRFGGRSSCTISTS